MMKILGFLLALLYAAGAYATCSAVPFTFSAGTTALSAQVNSNFAALVACINALDTGQITTGTLLTARGGTNHGNWTTGSVLYAASSTGVSEDNTNLFWDATNKRLSIAGTAVPLSKLAVGGAGNTAWQAYIQGSGATSATLALVIRDSASANSFLFRDNGSLALSKYSDGALYTVGADVTAGGAQAVNTAPSNPTGTASTVGVMAGLQSGVSTITPARTGRVLVTIYGGAANGTAGDGFIVKFRYGTGTGPANGAADTGNACVGAPFGSGNTIADAFSVSCVIAGLTVGSAYWFDLLQAAVTGGTATIAGIGITAVEL